MANLTRLSVLIGEADLDRSRATAELLEQLGVRHVVQVQALGPLLEALKTQAFDVLLCAERLGDADGVAALRAARDVAPATRSVLMRANDRAGEFVPEGVTAIELPFSRLELQGLLHRTAGPHGGLWCEVPELSLTDILQMYHQARRSITVLLSGPIAGRIWLEAGDIVHAEAGGERGMAALSHLLEAESGLVRTEPYQGPVARTISAPFQSGILEAAQRLDERRRDSMISNPPGSAPPASGQALSSLSATGHSVRYPAGGHRESSVPNPYPSVPNPGPRVGDERSSVSGAGPRLAMTPPVPAPTGSPESLLVAGQRRRRVQAFVAIFALLLIAGAAASFFANGFGSSKDQRAAETAETAPTPARSSGEKTPDDGDLDAPSAASAPLPPAELPPAQLPSPADSVGAAPSVPAPPAGAAPGVAAARAPAPPRDVPAPPPEPAGFELFITSKPARATVSEGNRVLGKTPLRLTINERSVADGPREFILRLPGYLPVKISQAASGSDVSASVVLSPRPVSALDSPDGGLYEPELDPADPAGARSSNPKARRKDLGIRLRR